jgi:hypothetical protein
MEGKILGFEAMSGIKSDLLLLAEFTSRFSDFKPNWVIATVYLTAMEIAVKRELKKRGKEIKEKFKDNFQSLLSCLKEKGVEVTELEKALPSIFWNIRHKVVHEGYSPENGELRTIVEHTIKLMEKIKKL